MRTKSKVYDQSFSREPGSHQAKISGWRQKPRACFDGRNEAYLGVKICSYGRSRKLEGIAVVVLLAFSEDIPLDSERAAMTGNNA